jgi:hypothetical protein
MQPQQVNLRTLMISGLAIVAVLLGLFAAAAAVVMMMGGPLVAAGEQVCPGQVRISKKEYSYKPGQHGTDHRVLCEIDGRVSDVTDRTVTVILGAAGAGGVVVVVIAVALAMVARRLSTSRRSPGLRRHISTNS